METGMHTSHSTPQRSGAGWMSLTVAAVTLSVACAARAQDGVVRGDAHDYRVVTVVDGLDHPWGLAFLPNGDMLVTERAGRLRIVRQGALDPTPIEGVPEVHARGQGGLLDVAVHPDFARNRFVYLSFSKPGPGGNATTAVIRARLDGNALVEVREIFEANAYTNRGQHFGSRLAFDREGFLYVSVGDRGIMDQAQNRSNHQGTISRLHDDGRIPADNPFVGHAGIEPSIFAYGVRNPQGLAIHPETGALWESEHGPRGGDELNQIVRGRNYGWPVISWGIDYSGRPIGDGIRSFAGMEQPVYYWDPSIATSGLAIVSGDRFPEWRGNALVGGLAGMHLARVVLENGRATHVERLLAGRNQRIRDVRIGPDGLVYVLVDASPGPLLRLEPVERS